MHPNIKNKQDFKILLIGGFDSTGGAGLQRDLEFQRNNENLRIIPTFYSYQGENFILQNIKRSYFHECMKDICHHWQNVPVLIKVGALNKAWQIAEIIHLKRRLKNVYLLYDPVVSSSRGNDFLDDDLIKTIKYKFFNEIDLLTPNIDEVYKFSGLQIESLDDYKKAKNILGVKALLIKGGHHKKHYDYFANATDAFFLNSKFYHQSFRGTGCSLGSLIIRGLSEGLYLEDAIVWAKAVLSSNLKDLTKYIELKRFVLELPQISFDGHFERLDFPSLKFNKTTFYPIVSSFIELEKIIDTGIKLVQLRIKDQLPYYIQSEIKKCLKICQKFNVYLFVNDHWEIAIDENVHGIHLGFENLQNADLKKIQNAGLFLGVSSHSYLEAAFVSQFNPSYIALGPIYHTTLKNMRFHPQGENALRTWVKIFKPPVVAIGGITLENCDKVLQTKPGFISAVQDIARSKNPNERVNRWLNKISELSPPV